MMVGNSANGASFTLAAMNCHHRFFPLEAFFRSARDNGYSAVEIWLGPQHFFVDYAQNDPVERLLRLEDAYGLKVIGICPEQTNPKPANMAARDDGARARAFSYFKRVVDLAVAVRANQVVVTPGWGFLDEPVEASWSRSVSMLQRVSGYAEECGMILAVEALQPFESRIANTASDLARLIDEVGSPALKICLDTGAMSQAGDTIDEYFAVFGDRVAHAHFVDVRGSTTHLAWGDGDRDMISDLRAFRDAGYTGALSVESIDVGYFADPSAADRKTIFCYGEAIKRL